MLNETFAAISQKMSWAISSTIATVAGWFAGETMIAFQAPPPAAAHWYESPLIVAGIVAGCFALLPKILERIWQNSDNNIKRMQELYEKEILFIKGQRNLKDIEAYEARLRAHAAVNEVNRLHLYIHILHKQLNQHNLEIPEFVQKSVDDLMEGIAEKVEAFKKTLVEQIDDIHHSKTK